MSKKFLLFLLSLTPALGLLSCSESEDETDEYANWQERNEAYFSDIYAQAIASAADDTDTIRSYALTSGAATSKDDYIVVKKLISGTSASGSPMFTDSVKISYRGRLIPTDSYPDGLVFDQTYQGEFAWDRVNTTSALKVSEYVTGITTALLNMRIGDYWRVYIPYKLGYGVSGHYNSSGVQDIFGYTTLIFDVSLHAFYRPDAGNFNTKAGAGGSSAAHGEWITE